MGHRSSGLLFSVPLCRNLGANLDPIGGTGFPLLLKTTESGLKFPPKHSPVFSTESQYAKGEHSSYGSSLTSFLFHCPVVSSVGPSGAEFTIELLEFVFFLRIVCLIRAEI